MIGRALLLSGTIGLAACTTSPPPRVLPPPAPGNVPRITTQLVCYEDWGNFNVVYWQWSTVDGNAHVQVQDVTNHIVTKDFVIPLGGGKWWQRLTQGAVGKIMWESSPGVWKAVVLFPGNAPLPVRCTWAVPPV